MRPDGPSSERPTTPVAHDGALQAITRFVPPAVGKCLGHFRIEEQLGRGGLGIVFRAYDEKLARHVALKVLAEASAGAGGYLLQEARAAASLTHPCIAAIYNVEEHEGVVFIVMELVPGATLRDEIRRGPIDPATVTRYARDIAAGLARAHQSGIVHRDLKPENVMVTPEGTAKILDFGLAKDAPEIAPASGEIGATGISGTPAYMAPEQARGTRVDARADVFSLGVVVYEMLAGKRPFAPPRWGEPQASAADEWTLVAPLRTAAPGVPEGLARVVDRCLALDRATRFANGGEVLGALRSLEGPETRDSERSDVEIIPAAKTTERAPRSSRTARVVAAAFATLLVVTGAVVIARVTGSAAVTATPAPDHPSSAVAPTADDPTTAALRAALEQARTAWRAGDERARGMLEKVVHEVERTNARASTPPARLAAEAVFLLGDLDEKAIAAPTLREPTGMNDLGPGVIAAAQEVGIQAARRYGEVALWGPAIDMTLCGQYRTGRVYEKLSAIARVVEARDFAVIEQPAIEALYPGGRTALKAVWSPTLSGLRAGALACYDVVVSMARFADGHVTDPLDGSDCHALALARRKVLATDAGP